MEVYKVDDNVARPAWAKHLVTETGRCASVFNVNAKTIDRGDFIDLPSRSLRGEVLNVNAQTVIRWNCGYRFGSHIFYLRCNESVFSSMASNCYFLSTLPEVEPQSLLATRRPQFPSSEDPAKTPFHTDLAQPCNQVLHLSSPACHQYSRSSVPKHCVWPQMPEYVS